MVEINIFIAFAAGLVSFLSPCVFPLIPAFLSYLAGTSINEIREKEDLNPHSDPLADELWTEANMTPLNKWDQATAQLQTSQPTAKITALQRRP